MDFNETLLKERFEAAVGDLNPDTVTLAGAALTKGRQLRRRRRVAATVGAAVVAAVVAGGVTYVGNSTDTFGAKSVEPAGPNVLSQREPATPRGLAAAVMTHTEGLGTLTYAAGELSDDNEFPLSATIGYQLAGGQMVSLAVSVTPEVALWKDGICKDPGSENCRLATLPDGTQLVIMREPATSSPESFGTTLEVLALRDDQIVMVTERWTGLGHGALAVEDLTAIVADPEVGMSTTSALNAAGQDIPDFTVVRTTSEDQGSASGSATASTSTSAVPPPAEESQPGSSSATSSAPPR